MPLQGIKVVDLTSAIAGSFFTMLLGDMGADVIKIEPPTGEHYRHAQDGSLLLAMNRNKRGIVLDLRTREGQEIALKLASKSDVFAENFVPGTVEKLGLGYDKVSQLNPRIVYCSVSGYGQSGPYRQRPGYDVVAQAMSGIMIATGEPNGKPVRQVTSLIDQFAAAYAAFAIVVSLLKREKTGKGERIDISLFDSAISAMSHYVTHHSYTGELPQRMGSGHTAWCPYQAFDTKDAPVFIGVSTDKFWGLFCQALNLDDYGSNPHYSTAEKRKEHRAELVRKISEICHQYSAAELESKLVAAGIPCSRLRTIAELDQDPQVQHRGIIEETNYPGIGKIKAVRTPIMFSGELPETRLRPPLLGEHTSQVLTEMGYSEEEVHRLIEKGVAVQYAPHATKEKEDS